MMDVDDPFFTENKYSVTAHLARLQGARSILYKSSQNGKTEKTGILNICIVTFKNNVTGHSEVLCLQRLCHLLYTKPVDSVFSRAPIGYSNSG